jgi:hypothetical protein
VQEPEPHDPESHRDDSSTPVDPDADGELELESRWARRRRGGTEPTDTGVQVVVPTGQPGRVGPRLTGRRPAHSHTQPTGGTGGRGWLVAAAAVALLVASVAVVDIARGDQRSDIRLGNPSGLPLRPSNLWPIDGSKPPDYGTLPPDAGVPGDGSAPPTPSGDPSSTAPVPGALPGAQPGAAPPPRTYTAVTGEGCSQTADHGYFRKGFAPDWRTRTSGGLATDGCHGAVVAVPMSGDARKDDNDNVVVWWFKTAPVTGGTCAVSVYVPDTGDASDSAGRPAHYLVFGSDNATGATIAEFDVDQTRNRGRWVDAGRFATGGRLSVRMVTRGVDFGPGRDGAHLGVSALRTNCTAG